MTTDSDDMFDDLFGGFEAINQRFEQLFSNLTDCDVKTYGYTMVRGPDGVPHVHEYGNAIEDQHSLGEGVREPLTDVSSSDDGKVRVVVELPGVEKEDIGLEGTKDSLKVSVDTTTRKFEKTLALPNDVDPNSAVARYNNGILEVTMTSLEAKPRGKKIAID
jgi:HSP20 family protein